MAVLVAFVDALLQLLFVLLGDGCKDVRSERDLCDVVGEKSCERSDARTHHMVAAIAKWRT